MIAGLDMPGRAAVLGISCRAYVDLAERDRRIVADPMLTAPGLRRWIAAGSPEADLSRLEFCGDDSVRALVVEVLHRVPMPVAWHTVEHVVIVEVGRGTYGWQGAMPLARSHMIALSGALDDDRLANVVPHEIAHSFASPACSVPPSVVRMPRSEYAARLASVGVTLGELASIEATGEKQADDLAELWGFKRHHTRQPRSAQ